MFHDCDHLCVSPFLGFDISCKLSPVTAETFTQHDKRYTYCNRQIHHENSLYNFDHLNPTFI